MIHKTTTEDEAKVLTTKLHAIIGDYLKSSPNELATTDMEIIINSLLTLIKGVILMSADPLKLCDLIALNVKEYVIKNLNSYIEFKNNWSEIKPKNEKN